MASKSSKKTRGTIYARVKKQNYTFVVKAAAKADLSVAAWIDQKITAIRNKKAPHA